MLEASDLDHPSVKQTILQPCVLEQQAMLHRLIYVQRRNHQQQLYHELLGLRSQQTLDLQDRASLE